MYDCSVLLIGMRFPVSANTFSASDHNVLSILSPPDNEWFGMASGLASQCMAFTLASYNISAVAIPHNYRRNFNENKSLSGIQCVSWPGWPRLISHHLQLPEILIDRPLDPCWSGTWTSPCPMVEPSVSSGTIGWKTVSTRICADFLLLPSCECLISFASPR